MRLGLVILGLILVLSLVLFVLPVQLDISRYKQPVEEMLTSFVEAPTTIEQLHLRLSLWPTVTVKGIAVEGTGWDDAPLFSRIEHLEVQISLLPLLKRTVRMKKLHAADLTFHAHRPKGTRGNWPKVSEISWQVEELAGIELDRIAVFLDDHDLGEMDLYIDQLSGGIAENRPLDLTLQGQLEGEALSLAIDGPTLADLSPGATDLPLTVRLALSDLELSIDGVGSHQLEGTRFQLAVRAESEELAFLRLFTDVDPPEIGGIELGATISNRLDGIDLREIDARIGPAALRGELSLGGQGPRPKLEGRVALDRLDLAPWLAPSDERESEASPAIAFAALASFDADLDLGIHRVDGLGLEVTEIAAAIHLTDGVLTAPVSFDAAGISVTTEWTLNATAEDAAISATGTVETVTLAQLRSLIDIDERQTGSVGLASLDASTQGGTLEELRAGLTVDLELRDTRLELADDTGGSTIVLDLAQTRLTHRTAQPLTIASSGRLFEIPFELEMETASATGWLDRTRWPIDLSAQGAGAEVHLGGAISRQRDQIDLDLGFSLTGERLSDLHKWLGVAESAQIPYRLQGHLTTLGGQGRVEIEDALLGRNEFWGDFAWQSEESAQPTEITLHAITLDLEQLHELFDPVTRLDSDQEIVGIDQSILPGQIRFSDIEAELTVDRLLRKTVDLTHINASLSFREGSLHRSPFSFNYRAARFQGEIALDLQQERPRFSLLITGSGETLGELLEREELLEHFTITARAISLELDAEGSTLRQMARTSEISGEFHDVRFQVRLPESEETFDVGLESVRLNGSRGEPLVLLADGLVEGQPLNARLELRLPERFQDQPEALVPFELEVEIAATDALVDGEVRLPIKRGAIDLGVEVSGDDLASLSRVIGADLPSIGPYRVQARFAAAGGSYSVSDLAVQVAESTLGGTMQYQQLQGRPTFTADLSSPLIRSVDFLPEEVEDHEPAETKEQESNDRVLSGDQMPELRLDFLQDFDASIHLDVQRLETRQGPLANLSANAELDHGEVDVVVERPQEGSGEPAGFKLHFEPAGDEVVADLTAHWKRQRYGLLADVLNPGNAKGVWSVDVGLSTRGSDFDEFVAGLDGHIDFTDYPEDFEATILDLWGGGLVSSVLPVFRLGQESRLNCTVGRFQVEEGVLTPELLVLDSTRSRVRGKGSIDLPADKIQLKLKPRPKQRSLINLATPMAIGGRVTDPSIRVAKGGLATTFFRLSLWAVTVWRDLLRKPLPTDGSDICIDPPPRTEP